MNPSIKNLLDEAADNASAVRTHEKKPKVEKKSIRHPLKVFIGGWDWSR